MVGPARRLSDLTAAIDVRTAPATDPEILGLAYDSRRVRPGYAFVAITGFVHDGHDFIDAAIDSGASVIVSEREAAADSLPWLRVADARAALAALACAWFDHPSHALQVAAVTGTNGKTTVTALLEALLATRGAAGRWSTTRVNVGDATFDTPRTTPEALELQESLARMRTAGCLAAVVEVSSHALRLHRVDGTRFAAATFTNLSPDHLDFHRDMADYLDAKASLFERLDPSAAAILNLGDPAGAALRERTRGRPRSYGWEAEATGLDYAIVELDSAAGGSRLKLAHPGGVLDLDTPLFGRANAENIAAAVATALEMGVEADAVAAVVAEFAGEPGRLEAVQRGQSFATFVDFAHTPGALRAALESCRGVTDEGRLIVVFGCGGDRDRAKRPLMGAIAAELADQVIVTSDNPRSEEPRRIIDEIVAGIDTGATTAIRIEPDRERAIDAAIALAAAGDCVLIAGKGHEHEQIFGDRVVPFDDRQVAAAAIDRLVRPEEVSRP